MWVHLGIGFIGFFILYSTNLYKYLKLLHKHFKNSHVILKLKGYEHILPWLIFAVEILPLILSLVSFLFPTRPVSLKRCFPVIFLLHCPSHNKIAPPVWRLCKIHPQATKLWQHLYLAISSMTIWLVLWYALVCFWLWLLWIKYLLGLICLNRLIFVGLLLFIVLRFSLWN